MKTSVVVASILRLTLIFAEDLTDATWGLVNAFTWSNIEVHIAVLSACLPTFRPLIQAIFPSSMTSGRGYTKNSYGTSNVSRSRGDHTDTIGLRDQGESGHYAYAAGKGENGQMKSPFDDVEARGIQVTSNISTESERRYN